MDLPNNYLEAKKTRKKAPIYYWQDKAIETAKLLGQHRTRFLKEFQGLSNADADMRYNWAVEILNNPNIRKPIAMFLDRLKDPKKYTTPFKQ